MTKPSKPGLLDLAAICRSSDPMAVRELITKIGDKWTIFVVLSLDSAAALDSPNSNVWFQGFHSGCSLRL
jgi:hypothetical protein